MEHVRNLIRAVPDFPKPGILFRDLTPVMESPAAFAEVVDAFAMRYHRFDVRKVIGIESRGFIFGAALARALKAGFTMARKPGKLPRKTISQSYDLEYGHDTLFLHEDAIQKGERVVIVDDLIATGGTAGAAVQLAQRAGGEVFEVAVAIELAALKGRAKLQGVPLFALFTY